MKKGVKEGLIFLELHLLSIVLFRVLDSLVVVQEGR